MKIGTAVTLSLAAAAMSAFMPLKVVWEEELQSVLLWNNRHAYVFVARRRNFWTGTYLRAAGEFVKAALNVHTAATTHRNWIDVWRISADGIDRHKVSTDSEKSPDTPSFTAVQDRVYAVYEGAIADWSSGTPEPVADTLRETVMKHRLKPIESTAPGWRRVDGLLSHPGTRGYDLTFSEGSVLLESHYDAGAGSKLLRISRSDNSQEVLLSLVRQPRYTNSDEYRRALEEQ